MNANIEMLREWAKATVAWCRAHQDVVTHAAAFVAGLAIGLWL